MTIEELQNQFSEMHEELRADVLRVLWKLFSPVSQKTLLEFQRTWDGDRPYEEFVVAQNKEILSCVDLELSETGAIVRETLGLPPFLPSTTLGPAEEHSI